MLIPIIDAHLDLGWSALSWNRDLTLSLEAMRAREKAMTDHRGRGQAVITLEEMRRGRVMVCLATLLARSKPAMVPQLRRELDFACQDVASATAFGQLAYYRILRDRELVEIITASSQLQAFWNSTR